MSCTKNYQSVHFNAVNSLNTFGCCSPARFQKERNTWKEGGVDDALMIGIECSIAPSSPQVWRSATRVLVAGRAVECEGFMSFGFSDTVMLEIPVASAATVTTRSTIPRGKHSEFAHNQDSHAAVDIPSHPAPMSWRRGGAFSAGRSLNRSNRRALYARMSARNCLVSNSRESQNVFTRFE